MNIERLISNHGVSRAAKEQPKYFKPVSTKRIIHGRSNNNIFADYIDGTTLQLIGSNPNDSPPTSINYDTGTVIQNVPLVSSYEKIAFYKRYKDYYFYVNESLKKLYFYTLDLVLIKTIDLIGKVSNSNLFIIPNFQGDTFILITSEDSYYSRHRYMHISTTDLSLIDTWVASQGPLWAMLSDDEAVFVEASKIVKYNIRTKQTISYIDIGGSNNKVSYYPLLGAFMHLAYDAYAQYEYRVLYMTSGSTFTKISSGSDFAEGVPLSYGANKLWYIDKNGAIWGDTKLSKRISIIEEGEYLWMTYTPDPRRVAIANIAHAFVCDFTKYKYAYAYRPVSNYIDIIKYTLA